MQPAPVTSNFGLTEWKSVAEIIAYLSAAVFFFYKVFSGYLIANISIKLKCDRQRSTDRNTDHLAILASLAKGDRGSVNIHDAQARVSIIGGRDQIVSLIGIERLSYRHEKLAKRERKIIDWNLRSVSSPFIRLSPGEEVEFASVCDIPHGVLCTVEVTVIGKRLRSWKVGQWRASLVSLPTNIADFSQ